MTDRFVFRLLSRRPLLGALLVAPLAAVLASPTRAAEPVFPPAAALGLAPPPGMVPAKGFAGFEHRSGASIVLAEMPPEAWDQISAKFTSETLAATGFRVKGERTALSVAAGEGFVLRGSQAANGLAYAKWVAVVRGPPGTGLVTVQVPETAAGQVPGAAVEAALRTIAFHPKARLADQVAALPYTVGDLAGYRPVTVFAGNGLLLTEGPKDTDPARKQPAIVIAPSLGRAATARGAEVAVARKLFATLAGTKDIAVTEEDRSTRDGAVVVRLRGTGTDTKTARAPGLTQTMVFDDARYLRVLGFADVARTDALTRAERVAELRDLAGMR